MESIDFYGCVYHYVPRDDFVSVDGSVWAYVYVYCHLFLFDADAGQSKEKSSAGTICDRHGYGIRGAYYVRPVYLITWIAFAGIMLFEVIRKKNGYYCLE